MPEEIVKICIPFSAYLAINCAVFEAQGYLGVGSRVEREMARRIVEAFQSGEKNLEYVFAGEICQKKK